ncbi:MAG TPA: SDR family oxidoreductase [Mycobacteriales bacterium]|nr:SDR family oxidoreductase [Mycobacteriales bacterium]
MTGAEPRTAVVTGAAGGIGAALCARLREDGFVVVGLDRVPSPAADVSVETDLSDLDALVAVAGELAGTHAVAAVVHNAAAQPLGGAGEVDPAAWQDAFRVNVLAADVLVGAFRSRLETAGGSVAVVGSVHGRATTRGIAAYATTKAALEGWVRAAALDLAPAIRVNAVVPGAIDTPKLQDGFARWGAQSAAERLQVLLDRTPLHALGAAADVAAAVSFLVSDSARFVTGASLVVDGGATTQLGSE